MAIIHIVHFGYKSDLDQAAKKEIASRFLNLQSECTSKADSKPYIQSVTGGVNNSPEGMSHGLEHSFVVKFANDADRQYYLFEDPAHLAFADWVRANGVAQATVMDFEEGQF